MYTNKTLPLFTAGPAFQILTVRREQAIKIESIMRKLNMLVAFASVLTFVSSSTAAQSSIDGHWEGVMVRQGSELIVSFDFSDVGAVLIRIRLEKWEQDHLHGCHVCQGVLYAYLDQPTTTSSDIPPESVGDAA